jgi:hypothetical protein
MSVCIDFNFNKPGFDSPFIRPVVPEKGKIRFITNIPNYNSTNWMHNELLYKDRTVREWDTYFKQLSSPMNLCPQINVVPNLVVSAWDPNTPFPNIYTHRHQVVEWMYKCVCHNIRMRWLARKFVARIRVKLFAKRVIGNEADVANGLSVPEKWAVRVMDLPSKRTYVFHTYTIQNTILQSLSYQIYGISDPKMPKNPYTNIVWSIGQLIEIVNQITTNLMHNIHKLPKDSIMGFCQTRYDIEAFRLKFYKELQLKAAQSHFLDTSNDEFLTVFEETVVDILEDIDMPKDGRVFQHVSTRSVERELLREWDHLATSYWVYFNYFIVIHESHINMIEMRIGAHALYKKTLDWIINKSIERRQITRAARRQIPDGNPVPM